MIKRAGFDNLYQITALWRDHIRSFRGAVPHEDSDLDYAVWADILHNPIHRVIVKIEKKNVVALCHSHVQETPGFPLVQIIDEVINDKTDELFKMSVEWAKSLGVKKILCSSPMGSKNKIDMEQKGFKAVSINYIMGV